MPDYRRLSAIAALVMIGAAPPAPPLARYAMDIATTSGMGAGMMGGGHPSMGQMVTMMGGGGVVHSLDLRLSPRTGVSPPSSHVAPLGLRVGPLPLLPPEPTRVERATDYEPPRGRILIYWGCGEHVGAGQPQIIDIARVRAGGVPPALMAMSGGMGQSMAGTTGFDDRAARWPNRRDSRPIPGDGSLIGAHQVQTSLVAPLGFTLAPGQDFMPSLALREAGAVPSGAARLAWTMAPQATGYALGLFGAADEGGDLIFWSSAKMANRFPDMNFVAPAEVRRLIAAGVVLPASTSECLLPAEVARVAPNGLVTMIGYGPELGFAEAPRFPKWTARLRFKSVATMIRGLSDAGAQNDSEPARPRKRKRFGIGDVLKGVIPQP